MSHTQSTPATLPLPDFLLARIAEDEDSARSAGGARWASLNRSWDTEPRRDIADVSGKHVRLFAVPMDADEHVARWSPARVLAECEAKRRIVEMHTGDVAMCQDGYRPGATHHDIEWAMISDGRPTGYCDTLRALALPYADHRDYRKEWKP